MNIEKLYEIARLEDDLAKACYQQSLWEEHRTCVLRRNAFMALIYQHPDNVHTKAAINCRVISGLSGKENELKATA